MKTFPHFVLGLVFLASSSVALAQNNDDALSLVKAGVVLNHAGKYAEAIDKYKQALTIDSNYLYADFQLAYSLSLSGKGKEAIPYLNKVIAGQTVLAASAYSLLADVYNKDQQTGKAVETYRAGIAAFPADAELPYNLGLLYWHNKQYNEAENSAIEALKIDPKHANSQRMYALVTFHQNKRAAALLGFCSFILLEPATARSAEAYGNIQHILQGGALKPEPGEAASHAIEADTYALNQAITNAVAVAGKEKHATAADLLAAQLKGIFVAVGQLAEKQTGNDFFRNYLAAYFYKLAQSPNMPAFARLISLSTPESAKWAKDNTQQMADLDNWVKSTERNF